MLPEHGTPWLLPFSDHCFHILPKCMRISTGHFTERRIIAPACVLALAFLAFHAVAVALPAHSI